MAKTHLTDASVERYRRPLEGRTEVSDTEPGLFLWITPNGTKSWAVIYRLPGTDGKRSERRRRAIGRSPAMGVAAARTAAREMMTLATQGIDPEAKAAEGRATEEREAASRRARSFRNVTEEYVAAMKAGKLIGGRKRPVTSGTAGGRESLLTRLVLPVLGDTPLADVTPTMIARLLSHIEKEGGPVDATLKNVRGVFKFAQSRGLFHGAVPTGGMTARCPPSAPMAQI
jgi:hypothetical protein